MTKTKQFSFKLALHLINDLGRNLYRNFTTVLGEAISNAWDADAKNVWLYIDPKNNNFVIKDDGIGMSDNDFQNKFLKIGYSKRKGSRSTSAKGRPYIGRKGIGKLALLPCAKTISIISKTAELNYVGGTINNIDLNKAMANDCTSEEYKLGEINYEFFDGYTKNHKHGTIIYFEDFNFSAKNNLDFLKKTIALYFRFSLFDPTFNIFLNGEKITLDHLNKLANKTEFLWNINNHQDEYIREVNLP